MKVRLLEGDSVAFSMTSPKVPFLVIVRPRDGGGFGVEPRFQRTIVLGEAVLVR